MCPTDSLAADSGLFVRNLLDTSDTPRSGERSRFIAEVLIRQEKQGDVSEVP